MNTIKNIFNIKDLENLSGIKAHTIRIWEKRYNILEPMRTDTNIRFYDIENLQKLLNITTLHNFGYKISAISKMPAEKLPVLVKEILSKNNLADHVLNNFKLSMMNFDQALFLNTYNSLLQEKSFREIFHEFFIPLLSEIGYLWQTNTITPAHEHFISYLIKQKLASNTEKIQITPPSKTDRTYVLYLPQNEIHELGLMFLNYELVLNGYKTVYLGESVPLDNLRDVKTYFNKITFITYSTIAPDNNEISNYVNNLKQQVVNDNDTRLYIFGRNGKFLDQDILNNNIKVFESIAEFTNSI
ncbi:MerR family transcriptional regulator [Flavobacterium sp.]|uniref:MerR family transcriptional regulator n=1 Tax=Flavobacterium sp. TaxID=239 RepID=UPI003A8CA9EB